MTSLPIAEPHPGLLVSRPTRRPRARTILLGIVAVLLAGAAVTCNAYNRDLRSARESALSGGSLLQTSCGLVEYAEMGTGSPVLSIHGTGGGWDQGLFIARGLIDRGYRVIAPSRYGYLRTPMPDDASPQYEATTFACILDELGIERVAVIAASAGATPALQFALQYPERVSSLVLLVPAVGGISPPDTVGTVPPFVMNHVLRSDFIFWAAMKAWPPLTLKVVAVPQSLVPTLTPEGKRNLDQAIAGIFPVSLRHQGILYDATNQMSELPYELDRIEVPTLLVSAEDDLFNTLPNARAAAAAIPSSQLIEYKTGGHLLLDRDAHLWPAIVTFMESCSTTYCDLSVKSDLIADQSN